MDHNRLKQLQFSLKTPVLIKKKENLFYLTGRSFDYRAEEYLLVTKKDIVGFGSGLERIDWVKKADRLKNIGKYIKGKKLDIEWGFTYGEGEYIKSKVKSHLPAGKAGKLKVIPNRSPVDEMRQVKEPEELSHIRKSMQIVEKIFFEVKKKLKDTNRKRTYTERSLAEFITKTGLRLGAQDVSFPAIVASGANSAIPHHVPSAKKLKAGESIIIDFGFKYNNYCSDFTRTVFLKTVPKKLEVAYNLVEKAYLESMEFIDRAMSLRGYPKQSSLNKRLLRSEAFVRNDRGVRAGDVYQKAVDVLKEKNLDKYFIHSLGHGTGLEIHELPNLSPDSKDVLKNNMVFSIEPGVYITKLGGIRIEDLVYLRQGRVKRFISIPTDLKSNIL